ncbi:CPBP family intramembrane glutamic endopeptidase [Kocuria sp. CPCC 205300]|uniref:CPBP family intramembrane glutamic endopeptidase n=1 Tax=Kocuria sabuli TaxID=3071448 RepID=UPI0036DBE689
MGASLLQGIVLLVTAVLLIHLWEETVWAGFVQTRLERRHSLVVAALLTAVPFAGIHVPIILIGESDVLSALGGVLVLGAAMRLLVGVYLRGTGGSLLAAGLVHGVYNACNNNGALVDGLLQGADQNLAAPIALVVVTAGAAAIHHRSKPGPERRRRHGTGQGGTGRDPGRGHQLADANNGGPRAPRAARPRRTPHHG